MLPPELPALNDWRCAHGLTWVQLGDAMRRADLYVSPTTLNYLVKRARPDVRVNDRTQYRITKFVEKIQAEAAAEAARKPRARRTLVGARTERRAVATR